MQAEELPGIEGGRETLRYFETGAPVVDETNTSGNFDFMLRWTPASVEANAGASDASQVPSIFTAVEEQLGLRLESRRRVQTMCW